MSEQVQGIIPEFALKPVHSDKGVSMDKWRVVQNIRTEENVAIVSRNYNLVQHSEIMSRFQEIAGKLNLQPGKVSFSKNSAHMHILAKFTNTQIVVDKKVGDIVDYGVAIENSVDKTRSIRISAYTFRLKCTNGMTHAQHEFGFTQRHLHLDRNGLMVAMMEKVYAAKVTLETQYRRWTTENINLEAAVELVKDLPKKYQDRIELGTMTKWEFFNLLTDANSHDNKRDMDMKLRFDRKIDAIMAAV